MLEEISLVIVIIAAKSQTLPTKEKNTANNDIQTP